MNGLIRKNERGFTLTELMVVIAIITFIVGMLLPALRRPRPRRRASCLNNIKQILNGIFMYSMDNHDTFPGGAAVGFEDELGIGLPGASPRDARVHWVDLGRLYPDYVSALDVFVCRSSTDKKFKRERRKEGKKEDMDDEPFDPTGTVHGVKEIISYAYGRDGSGAGDDEPSVPWTAAAPSTTRIIADKLVTREITRKNMRRANHGMDGRNVGFVDTHVEFLMGPKGADAKGRTFLVPLDSDPNAYDRTTTPISQWRTDNLWWSDPAEMKGGGKR